MAEWIIEKQWEYKDYPCVVVALGMGHRCGYVGLYPEHPFYHVNYSEIPVDCHGGLTYGRNSLVGQDQFRNVWWIGFDCAHVYDKVDESIIDPEYGMTNLLLGGEGTVKTLKFCVRECKNMVRHLKSLERRKI